MTEVRMTKQRIAALSAFSGGRVLTAEDAHAEIGAGKSMANTYALLSKMVRDGLLEKVRRGHYALPREQQESQQEDQDSAGITDLPLVPRIITHYPNVDRDEAAVMLDEIKGDLEQIVSLGPWDHQDPAITSVVLALAHVERAIQEMRATSANVLHLKPRRTA